MSTRLKTVCGALACALLLLGLRAQAAPPPPSAAAPPATASPPDDPPPDAPARSSEGAAPFAEVSPADPVPDPAPDPSLDVVVRAGRAPRSASAVTRDRALLQAAPHRSADELLTLAPGVFISQHGGEGKAYQIFYRGFDAVHGQDMEIWAGGAPVNDVSNLHGQGYADLHFLPVEVVRSLEVTPGTYDARQGDFAVAGTLRLELGYDHPGVTVKGGAGSYGTQRAFLAYRPRGAPEETFAAVELYETNGFGPSRAAHRASAVGQVLQPLGGGTALRLFASVYAGQFASPGVLRVSDLESGAVGRYATYDPTQGGASSRTQLVVELAHQEDTSSWSLSAYVVLRALRLRQNFTGYLTGPEGDASQQLNDDVVAGLTGNYRLRLPLLSPRDAFEAGVSARSDGIEQSQRRLGITDDRVLAREVDAHVRAHDVAGYLDLAVHPLARLTVRGGLRLDGLAYATQDFGDKAMGQARSSQGTHVGKKGTVDLRLTPALHALGSYGEGFRSPQARSLAENERTPFTSVVSAEVGLRLATDRVSASLAGFRTALSDDLVFDQASGRNERVPATRRLGLAGEVTLAPVPWLQAAAGLTYTRAQFTGSDDERHAGDLVPYAPQIVGRADLTVTRPLFTLRGRPVEGRLGAGASLLARRPLPYGQWAQGFFLLDGLAGLRVGGVELTLEGTNLLDRRYYDGEFLYASRFRLDEAASLVPQRHVTVGAPRLFLLSLNLTL